MLRHHTLTPIEDDTEEAPWMSMSDWQSLAVTACFNALEVHAGSLTPRPYVATMLPIRNHPNPGDDHTETLSPDALVVTEYVLFDPQHRFLTPALQGYRRDAGTEHFVQWSEVLEVWLVASGEELRLQRTDGSLVPLPRDSREAQEPETLARRRAEAEREQEAVARREAEAEVARLRAELEHRRSRR